LGFDDHDALVTDNDAGVWITLGGEGPQALSDLIEGDFLFGHVALGCECFGHFVSFLSVVPLADRGSLRRGYF